MGIRIIVDIEKTSDDSGTTTEVTMMGNASDGGLVRQAIWTLATLGALHDFADSQSLLTDEGKHAVEEHTREIMHSFGGAFLGSIANQDDDSCLRSLWQRKS